MKTSKLCTAAIVASFGVSMLGGVNAFAAPTAQDSTGTVTVTEGGTDPAGPTIDPEKPDEELPGTTDPGTPGENPNPDAGSLMIEKTTDLEFGEVKTSANDVKANAKPMSFDNGKTIRGAYVQWRDVRAGGTYGYTVTAELTTQFTGTNASKLTGSTIDFSNGMMQTPTSNDNVKPSVVNSGFQLTEDNGPQTAVTAAKTTKEGKGRYIMEFGQTDAAAIGGTPGTADKSVKLTIPAKTATNMALDTYTAKVTWKITAAK